MTSKTNLGLVVWCQSKLGAGYVYATYFSQVITEALIQSKARQYPTRYTASYIDLSRRWIGKQAGDCIGLIKGYYWTDDAGKVVYKLDDRPDTSANGMLSRATEKGTMDTLPEIPGILLHKDGHIGVYIGGGYAIEARGVVYGVVKTAVAGRGWTSWLKCPYIDYVQEDKDVLQKGDKGIPVYDYQDACKLLGYDIGVFPDMVTGKPTGKDGSYGDTMVNVTIQIQAKHGLPQTGIVDAATYGRVAFDLMCLAGWGNPQADLEAVKTERDALAQKLADLSGKYDAETRLSADWAQRASGYLGELKEIARAEAVKDKIANKYINQ